MRLFSPEYGVDNGRGPSRIALVVTVILLTTTPVLASHTSPEDSGDTATGDTVAGNGPGLELITQRVVAKTSPGSAAEIGVEVVNNGSAVGRYSIGIQNISRFFTFNQSSYVLEPGKSVRALFYVEVKEDMPTGVYRGSILVQGANRTQNLPVSVLVMSEQRQDLSMEVNGQPGDRFSIDIYNRGKEDEVSALLKVQIYDGEGSIVREWRENTTVGVSTTLRPDIGKALPDGTYRLVARLEYGNQSEQNVRRFSTSRSGGAATKAVLSELGGKQALAMGGVAFLVLMTGLLLWMRRGSDLTCEQCGKTFSSPIPYRIHQNIHSFGDGSDETAGTEGAFVCDSCGESFVSRNDYRIHINTEQVRED